MSELTNAEDRLRASLQGAFGLGGSGFDLLLLATHMMESAARSGNSVEDATRGSRHDKATAFSGHVDSGDAASAVTRDSDHSNGAVAVANEVREAAFGKLAASALQTSGTQLPPHILNAYLQLEKLPTEWVFGSSKIKNESATVHQNAYAPQSSEIVQPHDWSTTVAATQPVSADHDDHSTVSASSASDNNALAAHRPDSGDAGHNAASNDLSGGRPDLTSINGITRGLSATSASRTTVASDHAFQSTINFHSNDTASAQFSDSSRGSADTDGAGPGKLSAVPTLHGQNGFGSMSGPSFGTDATHQQTTVGGAPSVMADDVLLPGIQLSVVASDSTSLLVARQAANADAAALPSQDIGDLATDSPATADATNHPDLPVDVPGPEMHESNSSNTSTNMSTMNSTEPSLTASPTDSHADLSSSQATSPSLDAANSNQISVSAPVHEEHLIPGMNPDPAQTPDGPIQVPPAPSGVESAAGTPGSHLADAAHLQPPVLESEPPRPAIDSLSAHSAAESASTPTDAISIATPNDPGPNGTLPFSSSHGAPAAFGADGLPPAFAVAPALESAGSDSGSAAPTSHTAAAISADQSSSSLGSQHLAAGQDDSGAHPADPDSSLTRPDAHVGPVVDVIDSLPQTHVFMQGPPIVGAGYHHVEDISYHRTANITYVSPASNQQSPEVEAVRAHFSYVFGANGFDASPAAHPLDSLGSDPAHHVVHELTLDHSTPPPLPGLTDFHYDHPILDPGLGPDVHVDIHLWHSH